MRTRAQAHPSRHRRRTYWMAFALSALLGASSVLIASDPATAAVPTGYAVASSWTTSGTGATAAQIGGATYLGSVTSTSGNQVVGMDAAWTVDGIAVPRRQLTAASITASTTACLNGAPVDTLRECNGATSKITTVFFPVPTVNPIIALASRGAVATVPRRGRRRRPTARRPGSITPSPASADPPRSAGRRSRRSPSLPDSATTQRRPSCTSTPRS